MNSSNERSRSIRVPRWGSDMNKRNALHGVVLDSRTIFSLREFSRACSVEEALVLKIVEEGVIEPMGPPHQWRFPGEAVVRAQRALRLVRDLGVNLPGAALALDLLDRLERLETHFARRWDDEGTAGAAGRSGGVGSE